MSQILLVEVEKNTLKILTTVLKTEGYKTVSASSVADAVRMVSSGDIGLVIADSAGFSPSDGEQLKAMRAARPSTALIMLVKPGEEPASLPGEEIFALFSKPFKMDGLLAAVQRALDYSDKALSEMSSMRAQLQTAYRFSEVVAESPAMRSVCDMISRIAATEVNVLISGENGTGKTLMARIIHAHSMRKDKKFSEIDCSGEDQGALDGILFGKSGGAGVLESTNGGTVFLAGVESLPMPVQAKLVTLVRERQFSRAGEDRAVRVDLRLLAGTGSAEAATRAGRLNAELYGILKAISIVIPPLRNRIEDIDPLVHLTLNKLSIGKPGAVSVDPEAMKVLRNYAWPGNVRELEEVVKRAYAAKQGNTITVQAFPAHLQQKEQA